MSKGEGGGRGGGMLCLGLGLGCQEVGGKDWFTWVFGTIQAGKVVHAVNLCCLGHSLPSW